MSIPKKKYNHHSNETPELNEWFKKIASDDQRNTLCDDDTWRIEPFGIVDFYSLFIFSIFGGLKAIVMFVPVCLLFTLPVCINWWFFQNHRKRLDSAKRITVSTTHVWTVMLTAVPAILLIAINFTIDLFVMYLFGILYALFAWRWKAVSRNFEILKPFRRGPSIWSCMCEIMIACGGMILRQGFFEFMYSFTNMYLLNPWVKYWFSANPWLQTLDVRFVTQIGNSLSHLSVDRVSENFQRVISWSLLSKKDMDRVDNLFFAPHYPFPPRRRHSTTATATATTTNNPEEDNNGLVVVVDVVENCDDENRWAIGMQHTAHVTTLVHTTHAPHFKTLSRSCLRPVYRVMLWRNNPFHIYTAYVEANVSITENGIEHPMWIVSGHNDIASNRNRLFASGWIDRYFHSFMPGFHDFLSTID